MSRNLNPDKALIFRIVHVDNLAWLLENGLHCRNSDHQFSEYIPIGNPELIEKRRNREIPSPPGGVLGDYVPFYFTPYSPMMYNIRTGFGGIRKRENREIAILVSSLPRLEERGCRYVVADRHAYLNLANFFGDRTGLAELPWDDWQQRDFHRNPEDPERFERYQAEALVHRHLPVAALLGVVVYTAELNRMVERQVAGLGADLAVHALPEWYFS